MRAIVTGANRGIGRAIALKLARDAQARGERARIALLDLERNAEMLAVEAALGHAQADARGFAADLGDPAAPAAIVPPAVDWLGGLDALVCNAGIVRPKPLLAVTADDWDRVLAINSRAILLLGQQAHPHLKAAGGGLVAIASMSGVQPHPGNGPYSASKAAAIVLVQQMAQEWGPDGVRCNLVSPGMVRTSMTENIYGNAELKAAREALVPLRRVADPYDDIAGVVAFLLSPAAAYVNGQNIVADGGVTGSTLGRIPGFGRSPG